MLKEAWQPMAGTALQESLSLTVTGSVPLTPEDYLYTLVALGLAGLAGFALGLGLAVLVRRRQ